MDNFLPQKVHDEYAQRMSDWNKRQDARIQELEDLAKENREMTISIEKLANSMESMMKELQSQGQRLTIIENRDGEMWRKVVGYTITAIVGGVIGYILKNVGM